MSIILTAGKRSVKPKSAKGKKKRGGPQFNPTPPLSSARTSVWYWELDGVPTTVMLTKESSEVWCNGQILDTIDGFAEDDTSSGGHIDFCIYVEDTENVHKARIRRIALGSSGIHYELIVDGDMITEHTSSNSHMHLQRTGSCSDANGDEEGAEALDYMPYVSPEDYQAAYPYPPPPDPPSYNDVMAEDGCHESYYGYHGMEGADLHHVYDEDYPAVGDYGDDKKYK